MKHLINPVAAFHRWLGASWPKVNSPTPADIHIDELIPEIGSNAWVVTSIDLFHEIVRHPTEQLAGLAVLLVIPLHATERICVSAPSWQRILSLDPPVPPSLYVMHQRDRLLPWLVERFVTPVKPVGPVELIPFYSYWRELDAPREDGWEQDIRMEHAFGSPGYPKSLT